MSLCAEGNLRAVNSFSFWVEMKNEVINLKKKHNVDFPPLVETPVEEQRTSVFPDHLLRF